VTRPKGARNEVAHPFMGEVASGESIVRTYRVILCSPDLNWELKSAKWGV
jgi:hypothetical protein